jgi:uncharacterized protein YgbK (DUF1537 family)
VNRSPDDKDELAKVRAGLIRASASARAALRDALAGGRDTSEHRARLASIDQDVQALGERLSHLVREAEMDCSHRVAVAGGEIAAAVAARLRRTMARLAPPRPPAVLRRPM